MLCIHRDHITGADFYLGDTLLEDMFLPSKELIAVSVSSDIAPSEICHFLSMGW